MTDKAILESVAAAVAAAVLKLPDGLTHAEVVAAAKIATTAAMKVA